MRIARESPAIDLAASDPLRVLGTAPEPLLPLGQRGTFDDNGMMPSCIVADGQLRYLYYIGWNPQVTVSYRVSIGLAVSEDGGHTYRRVFVRPSPGSGPR